MVSRVFKICDAYESGIGHGLKNDGKNDNYFNDPELNEAYGIGYKKGLEIFNINDYNPKYAILKQRLNDMELQFMIQELDID